jgi:hypothetical protein
MDKDLILDTPEKICFYMLCARKHALHLEILGMRHSSRRSIYALCKKVYRLKGTRQHVYEQMCNLVEEVKRGNVRFVEPAC